MKPFLLAIATAMACLFLCSAKPSESSLSRDAASFFKDNTHYYWFLDEDDSYDSWSTVVDEMVRMENMYGGYVDANPYGGILVARGYTNNSHPHTVPASYFLYVHL